MLKSMLRHQAPSSIYVGNEQYRQWVSNLPGPYFPYPIKFHTPCQ